MSFFAPTSFLGSTKPGVSTVWNSADKNADIVLSGGDLTATKTASNPSFHGVRATISKAVSGSSFAVSVDQASSSISIGIAEFTAALNQYLGFGNDSFGYTSNGNVINNNTVVAVGPTYTTGDVIVFAWDGANFRWFKNGVLAASISSSSRTWFPAVALRKNLGDSTPQATANFSPDDPVGYSFTPWG